MNRLIVMRGISGAGKSTYIKNNFPQAAVIGTDEHMVVAGKYTFNPILLKQAQSFCWDQLILFVSRNFPLVVIDGINSQVWRFKPYITKAISLGYDVQVIRLDADPVVAHGRNTHGTPLVKNQELDRTFEPYNREVVISER